MLTRSDWMLEDETGCIYITGRIPNSLSPVQPKGERVLVKGRVITTKKGKPVIKACPDNSPSEIKRNAYVFKHCIKSAVTYASFLLC